MTTRYFIAIDPAIAVVEQLMTLQDALDEALPEPHTARWTHPEQIHISLNYLGHQEEALLDHLRASIKRLCEPLFPFQVQHVGLKAWPTLQKPRLLFSTLDAKGAEVIQLLQRALERELELIGIPPDPRPKAPGLQLGRLAGHMTPEALAIYHTYDQLKLGQTTIRSLTLMSAQLTADGPTYRVIDRLTLGL